MQIAGIQWHLPDPGCDIDYVKLPIFAYILLVVYKRIAVTIWLAKRESMKTNKGPKPTTEGCKAGLRNIGDALYVIGGKWKLRIIVALTDGNMRFNDLQRTVSGISARVLSNELKELELNGFIIRHVHDNTPVVVEYELTEYSDTLDELVQALSAWGAQHRKKILKNVAVPA
jgi:DNA-binding HxlR family transcriptional regulator